MGSYFVTICIHERRCLLGKVVGETVESSVAGQIVEAEWQVLPTRFQGLELDAMVVMPNHLHGILVLGQQCGSAASLGDILRAFKSVSALRINRALNRTGAVWQRNYFEHVIRGEGDLNAVREYIVNNPLKWALDRENPAFSG